MSRSKQPPAPPPHRASLAPGQALAEIHKIYACAENFCLTAPNAVAEFGGMAAVVASCQMTCIGAVPRLTEEQWEPMAAEHADAHREAQRRKSLGNPEGVRSPRTRTDPSVGAGTEVRHG